MLDFQAIFSELKKKSLNWDLLDGKMIRKEFVNKDFKTAMKFVNSVAELSEKKNHHPDIHIFYNKVVIELWTHSEGGVTNKDIELAEEIDKIILS